MKRTYQMFAVLVAIVLTVSSTNADTVYEADGSAVTSFVLPGGNTDSILVGDQVLLAGVNRTVQQIQVFMEHEVTDGSNYDLDVDINFFLMDGAGGTPGTLFHTQTNNVVSSEGDFFVNFGIADVVVPDEFAVIFQLHRNGGSNNGDVGFQFGVGNVVGFSDDSYYWVDIGLGGGFQQIGFGGTNGNLRMNIDAIPEPASLGLLAFAGLGLTIRRRRK